MIISLDYDGTYTEDPALWDMFVLHARRNGHQVFLITMRYPDEPVTLTANVNRVVYTSREAKLPYTARNNIQVDVWIDDRPDFILHSAAR